MRKLQEDIKLILDYCNVERAMNFEERKAYNRLLDFTQLHSIYQGIPVEDRLNEQDERIKELEKENKQLQIEVLGQSEEIEILSDENQQLKERNQRQYNRLKEITDLMFKRDWKTLEQIVEEWEKADELLQKEWHNYGDL